MDFAPFVPDQSASSFDAVILAGDILSKGVRVPAWASRPDVFGKEKPILFVAGNHEYYGEELQAQRRLMRQATTPNVHALDPGEVFLDQGRIRVLGCTLWTDFKLPISTAEGRLSDQRRAIDDASRYMSDYSVIDFQPLGSPRRRLTPADTLMVHETERDWLRFKLRESFDGTTVVVTHHAPSAHSVASKWASDWLTPSFVSDLPDEFFDVPALWVHGHTHASLDYVRGNTRVVCNPRGYRLRDGSFENPHFDPVLIVDVVHRS